MSMVGLEECLGHSSWRASLSQAGSAVDTICQNSHRKKQTV